MTMILLNQTNGDGSIYVNTAAIVAIERSKTNQEHSTLVVSVGVQHKVLNVDKQPSQIAGQINDAERRANGGRSIEDMRMIP